LVPLVACRTFVLITRPSPAVTSPLSLHDALPIWAGGGLVSAEMVADSSCASSTTTCPYVQDRSAAARSAVDDHRGGRVADLQPRSEEHTSELQSRFDLVCRLLLEKKKTHSTLNKS